MKRNSARKLILVYNSRVQSSTAQRSEGQKPEEASHITATVKSRERGTLMPTFLWLRLIARLIEVIIPDWGMMLSTRGWVFAHQSHKLISQRLPTGQPNTDNISLRVSSQVLAITLLNQHIKHNL